LSSNYAQLIDYAALVPATSFQSAASSTLRPTTAIRVDLDFNRQWYIPEESDLTTYSRLFTRFNWQFTEPMGLRLVQQTVLSSDDATQTTVSSLLTWMKVPGNELYVGTSMTVADSALVEQTLFAKFTHLWRL
jgi:hypothetical protein